MNATTSTSSSSFFPALCALVAALSASAFAGDCMTNSDCGSVQATSGFENVRRPISDPTLFDLALPQTNVHAIAMYQQLPDAVNTTLGRIPMGGDLEVYALQFEVALTDRLSLVATKDGYVVVHPKTEPLWSGQSGFANLAGGLKYAFIYDPAHALAVSGTMTFEFPTGNHDVFQGEGDGAVNLSIAGLKLWDRLQLAGTAGVHLPFDGQMASTSFAGSHISYEVSRWFIPLVELNWHHVLQTGSGRASFSSQAGGAVPQVATFEGSDLLNFGASNAGQHRDFVTAALGFRSRLAQNVDLGLAYELPLTKKEDGVMKDRVTFDVVWRF